MHLQYRPWLLALIAGAICALSLAQVSAQVLNRPFARRFPAGAQPNATTLAPANHDAAAIHLPRNKQVNWNNGAIVLTDGGNYRWEIYQNLNVGQCTNQAYNGGMNIQINNGGFGVNGPGFTNRDGDEIEIGPYPATGGINYSRRMKVYKDAPLARWIDIFENPTPQVVTVNFMVYSNMCWQIAGIKTNTGKNAFGADDWAVVTELNGAPAQTPPILHILCDKKSKIRPALQVQWGQFYVRYAFQIPAKSSAALCYFESQNKTTADHMKFLDGFKPSKYFKDLPGSARRMIVNSTNLGGVGGVDLERSDTADSVLLQRGDPMYGKITNPSFALQTLFGDITLEARQVVGMAARPGGETVFALTDGQIVSGKSPGTKIELTLNNGGNLSVPLDQIQQWSYQIDKARPADIVLQGPAVVLRTGDQLLFDAKALKLDFSTRHGKLQLQGGDLVEINMDNGSNGVHRAVFTNGSCLGGLLEGDKLSIPIKLAAKDQKIDLPKDLVYKFTFANEPEVDSSLPHLTLTNDDELYARLSDASLKIATEFNATEVKIGDIKKIEFSPTHLDRVVVTKFDGSMLRGQLDIKDMNVQVTPGPALTISTAQIVSIEQTTSMPTAEAIKKAEALIARLGSESYQDREKATEELGKLGDSVMPVLKKHLKESDPEVRQRILRVIEKLGGTDDSTANPQPLMRMFG